MCNKLRDHVTVNHDPIQTKEARSLWYTFCAMKLLLCTTRHVSGLHAVCERALVAHTKACCICGM